jgi:glycosyltransferase involved in cell wall biosynthesis
MLISLIVATLNRVSEIEILFTSLCAQNYAPMEVIIVDQNDDDRLVPLIVAFGDRLQIRHLRSSVRNLSHARNVGIAVAAGDIIAFPDDDCVYPDRVLDRVVAAFTQDQDLGVLTGPAFSPEGRPGSGRWESESGPINLSNVWTSVIAFNLFVRRAALIQVRGFDESFGVGAKFGSAEETDLVIRIIKCEYKCYYDFTLRIIHPDKSVTQVGTARAFVYGTGLGQVLRKHGVPARTSMRFFIRPIGGMVVNLLKMKMLGVAYYWQTLRGRVYGFAAAPALANDRAAE